MKTPPVNVSVNIIETCKCLIYKYLRGCSILYSNTSVLEAFYEPENCPWSYLEKRITVDVDKVVDLILHSPRFQKLIDKNIKYLFKGYEAYISEDEIDYITKSVIKQYPEYKNIVKEMKRLDKMFKTELNNTQLRQYKKALKEAGYKVSKL